MDRLEYVNWWGYSPATNFLESDVLKISNPGDDDENYFNILTVAAGDNRHILETLSSLHTKKNVKLHFFVVENTLEQYARHMLLLALVLESQAKLGIQEKTELFLEIHGNSLIRKQTIDYVERTSDELLKMVTNFDYLNQKLPVFDLSNLKFKERDFLEGIFKYWRRPDKNDKFDMAKCWDFRLRSYLGARYDAIPNIFDWHFHMRLVDKGAEIINVRNYLRWRKTGVAYQMRDTTYDAPNKTLASAVLFKKEGERYPTRGYWGDTLLSPYISFGIECSEKSFFKRCNKVLVKTSEDVAQYNLTKIIYQIIYKQTFKVMLNGENNVQQAQSSSSSQSTSSSSVEIAEIDVDDDQPADCMEAKENTEVKSATDDYIQLKNVKITFLPHNCLPEIHNKTKYQNFFHLAYFGNSSIQQLTSNLATTFRDRTTVYCETTKFLLDLNKDESQKFSNRIRDTALGIGCQMTTPLDENDAHAKFLFVRKREVEEKLEDLRIN